MKNVVLDFGKTLGDLYYIGCEESFAYENNKRTDKIVGYNYKLASSVQGDAVSVKVLGDKKEFKVMQPVKLVGASCKIFARTKGTFAELNYSLSAEDICNG